MPYGGLGSFLLIDYEYSNMNIQLVSMPYFGLLPFLPRIYGNSYTKKNDCFNALLRASFFSTCYHKEVITCYGGCFNALLRASFFSTIKSNMRDFLPENVSMPYFGLLSFLQVMWQLELFHGNVSMPYFGLLSFLPLSAVWHDKTVQSVSMPYFGLLSFLRYVSAPIDFTGFPASIL